MNQPTLPPGEVNATSSLISSWSIVIGDAVRDWLGEPAVEVSRSVGVVAEGAELFWPPQAVRPIAARRTISPRYALMTSHAIAATVAAVGLCGFWSDYGFVIIFDVVRAVDIASA
jgi:preprotein translocase subunit Sec61beta